MTEGHRGGDHQDAIAADIPNWLESRKRAAARPPFCYPPPGFAIAKRPKTLYLTIHQSFRTANFYATARGCGATGFQLFGANTAGQNVRVGCAKSTPT